MSFIHRDRLQDGGLRCSAACTINYVGEMKGFLKAKERLFVIQLGFSADAILLRTVYRPISRSSVATGLT